MPRYVRQRNKYSCGPVAIINAIKWAGGHVTMRKDFKRLIKATHCSFVGSYWGTNLSNLDCVLRHEGRRRFKVMRRSRSGIKAIEEHVRKDGCAAIINYCYPDKKTGGYCGHYMLLVDALPSGKTFICVNNSRKGPTVAQFRRSTIIDDLKPRFLNYPYVWFLTRLNN